MEGGWLISYIVLWVITLLLVILVLAHSRLLGLLHYRFGPANAKPLADGPELGSKITKLEAIHPSKEKWRINFPFSSNLVLVFVSPQCSTCNEVLPHVKDFYRQEKSIKTILVSIIDDIGMNQAYIKYRSLEKTDYVISEKMSSELNIEGVPYALFISREGIVKAKGLVNNYENLRGLTKTAEQYQPLDY